MVVCLDDTLLMYMDPIKEVRRLRGGDRTAILKSRVKDEVLGVCSANIAMYLTLEAKSALFCYIR